MGRTVISLEEAEGKFWPSARPPQQELRVVEFRKGERP